MQCTRTACNEEIDNTEPYLLLPKRGCLLHNGSFFCFFFFFLPPATDLPLAAVACCVGRLGWLSGGTGNHYSFDEMTTSFKLEAEIEGLKRDIHRLEDEIKSLGKANCEYEEQLNALGTREPSRQDRIVKYINSNLEGITVNRERIKQIEQQIVEIRKEINAVEQRRAQQRKTISIFITRIALPFLSFQFLNSCGELPRITWVFRYDISPAVC